MVEVGLGSLLNRGLPTSLQMPGTPPPSATCTESLRREVLRSLHPVLGRVLHKWAALVPGAVVGLPRPMAHSSYGSLRPVRDTSRSNQVSPATG